ncbi:MAG: right-handed parallel beta-helix repeat-containing protein [Euryarchaeota archaeon]|nr:right-handed parallel beta-helix repeat-containing protein [Euryarchaeota archaeon]
MNKCEMFRQDESFCNGLLKEASVMLFIIIVFSGLFVINTVCAEDIQPNTYGVIQISCDEDIIKKNIASKGDGSKENPYVIEGYNIDAHGFPYGIIIKNTRAHIIVKACNIYGAENAGIALFNVRNVSIIGCTIEECSIGLELVSSRNVHILECDVMSTDHAGITVKESFNVTIIRNEVQRTAKGISILESSAILVQENIVYENTFKGIDVIKTSSFAIERNVVHNNKAYGIHLKSSRNGIVCRNVVDRNLFYGITVDSSTYITLWSNDFLDNSILILGTQLIHYYTIMISENNTVNGKKILYLKNESSLNISPEIIGGLGEVIVVNSKNINITGFKIMNTTVGLEIAFSRCITIEKMIIEGNFYGIYIHSLSNSTIHESVISNNIFGIYAKGIMNSSIFHNVISKNNYGAFILPFLYTTTAAEGSITTIVDLNSNNNITENIISNNLWGIIVLSNGNHILRNNFIGNFMRHAQDYGEANTWERNYWDNYSGIDINKDGIGDTPYYISEISCDKSPLIGPIRLVILNISSYEHSPESTPYLEDQSYDNTPSEHPYVKALYIALFATSVAILSIILLRKVSRKP